LRKEVERMACIRKRRGRWVLDFYDHHGKRRWQTMKKGTTKEQARSELAEIERKIRHGAYTPVRALPTFGKVADDWLASKKPNVRWSTYHQYRGHVRNHLKPYFEGLKINQANFDAVESFKRHCLKEGVTLPTLRKLFISLGGILTYAVRMRYIDYNPARDVEKPRVRSMANQEDMVVLQPKQIRALLDKARDERDKTLFMAAVFTGLRQGELLGLKWGDIDWTASQILVRRTYNHGRFFPPKSRASNRRVDMAPELVSQLKKWKLACPPGELGLVFPSRIGTPWDQSNMVNRGFYPALRRAGLPRIRFHDLRHCFASLLISQNENVKYIQAMLGHASITMTLDIYGHLMKNQNQEAVSRLGRTILGDSEASGSTLVANQDREPALGSVTI
jgi:integrase